MGTYVNRRQFLHLAGLTTGGLMLGSLGTGCGATPASTGGTAPAPAGTGGAKKKAVVISGWGGAIQDAMRKAYFEPFTRETGIEVVEQTYGGDGLAKLKAQIGQGGAQVDILDGPPFWTVIGSKQGLLDKIDAKLFSGSDFLPGAINDYGLGYSTVAWGITYNTQQFAKGHPENWADFWDATRFPGRRTMFGSLFARHPEYALMADGVATKDVYPLSDEKIDRTLTKLAKPNIATWYQTGSQCEQMLSAKEVVLAEFFNGRTAYLAQQGVPVAFEWNQSVLNYTTWVLAKDAPNKENALQLLRFMGEPQPQANFASLIYYGPTNHKALDLIKDEMVLKSIPTFPDNWKKLLPIDSDWWGENLGKYADRWNQFISS